MYFHLINITYEKEAYFIQLNRVENKKKTWNDNYNNKNLRGQRRKKELMQL